MFVAKARMAAPAIIFFDEIDAIAVEREGKRIYGLCYGPVSIQ